MPHVDPPSEHGADPDLDRPPLGYGTVEPMAVQDAERLAPRYLVSAFVVLCVGIAFGGVGLEIALLACAGIVGALVLKVAPPRWSTPMLVGSVLLGTFVLTVI